jgi:hypothetical protein
MLQILFIHLHFFQLFSALSSFSVLILAMAIHVGGMKMGERNERRLKNIAKRKSFQIFFIAVLPYSALFDASSIMACTL